MSWVILRLDTGVIVGRFTDEESAREAVPSYAFPADEIEVAYMNEPVTVGSSKPHVDQVADDIMADRLERYGTY